MAIYQASVILEVLTIKANNAEEAEAKYDAWYANIACPSCFPAVIESCGCVTNEDEVGHTMERIAE